MRTEKYAAQVNLKEVGVEGLLKIQKTSVLVVGAGGLGCPALLYLAASGFGKIGLVDFDRVSLSNLSRQVLYSEQDIGKLKAEVAKEKLQEQNPDISLMAITEKLDMSNAERIMQPYQVVLDCSDNIATRYVIDEVCTKQRKPWIYAAVGAWEGMVARFGEAGQSGFSEVFPKNGDHLFPPITCSEQGVMGATCAFAASMQVNELVLLTIGKPGLQSKIFCFNLLEGLFRTLRLNK